MSTEASHTADWYVWTGEVGTLYNESSAPGYLYSVTMDATATAPVYADGASTVVHFHHDVITPTQPHDCWLLRGP